jgi:hypothetical protein
MKWSAYFSEIDAAMRAHGFINTEVSSEAQPFGNGSAEYENNTFKILVTIDRDHLQLDIKPRNGFASWKWHDAMILLKKLENVGAKVVWVHDNSPTSIGEFLGTNVGTLLRERHRLRFSYFDGASVKK